MLTKAAVRGTLAIAAIAMLASSLAARRQASLLQAQLAELEHKLDKAMLEYTIIKLAKQPPIELPWNTTEKTTIALFYQYTRPKSLVEKLEGWLSELNAAGVEVKEYDISVPRSYQLYTNLCKAAGIPTWPIDKIAFMHGSKLILISRLDLTREVLEACLKYLEG